MDIDLMDKIRLAVVNGVWPCDESSDEYYDDDDSYDSTSTVLLERECCINRKSSQAFQESQMILMERSLQADRNAQALLDEEEKEKMKLEKKRAKKRRKRGRMKARKQAEHVESEEEAVEDEENESNSVATPVPEETKKSKKKKGSRSMETQDNGEDILDINSAFVSAVCLKTGLTPKPVNTKENKSSSKKTTSSAQQKPNEPTTRQKLLGEQLASMGCQKASQESYKEAMSLFSRAIEVLPNDHRFWGNRSFCFLHLGDYKRALEDAEKAISLSPESSKAYYRKAEVLFALKDYAGAEESFVKVLELDKDCVDAQADLGQVRLARLMDMGFPKKASLMAIAEHSTVQDAVEALTSGNYNQPCYRNYLDGDINILNSNNEDADESCEEETSNYEASNVPRKQATINSSKGSSLWVGSVLSDVTEDVLKNLFQKYGTVVSVRLLPESSCAFVNFKESQSAEEAMTELQGYSLMGRNLLIRYPNKPKEDYHGYQPTVPAPPKPVGTPNYSNVSSNSTGESNGNVGISNPGNNFNRPKVKLKGPVNGSECYYWRTSGCAFGATCRYLHIQENCGVDRKAWHK